MNTVAITGRLTAHPELKTTPQGTSVCTFDVAVRRPKSKENITDFFTCVAWDSTAEFISRNFIKGQKIEIAGILTTRSWKDKNGNEHKAVEIRCDNVDFGESKKEQRSDNTFETSNNAQPDINNDFEELTDEDLPF